MRIRKIRYLIILFLGFSFFGGIPVEFGNEGAFFHGFMIPKPVISIGLGTNLKDLQIRSSSGMKIYEVKRYTDPKKGLLVGAIQSTLYRHGMIGLAQGRSDVAWQENPEDSKEYLYQRLKEWAEVEKERQIG
ncbi:MAG: hypothetical protein ACXVI6_08000, partial [Candidatus Aminicenantales bacterium]